MDFKLFYLHIEYFIREEEKMSEMKHKIDYENRLENISYEEAEKIVLDRLGFIKTKEGVGMMWSKKTKSINFLDEEGKIVAIWNKTVRDFWWIHLEI